MRRFIGQVIGGTPIADDAIAMPNMPAPVQPESREQGLTPSQASLDNVAKAETKCRLRRHPGVEQRTDESVWRRLLLPARLGPFPKQERTL